MPKPPFYEIDHSKLDKKRDIIKIGPAKPRLPQELRPIDQKAGPMTKKKPKKEDIFAYNRGAAETETREILEQQYERMSEREKRTRLSDIIKEFNLWSQNEHEAQLEGLDLYQKGEKLKEIVKQELADPGNQDTFSALQSWRQELEILCL